MATFTAGALGVDFDLLDLAPLAGATPGAASAASVSLSVGNVTVLVSGTGFTHAAAGPPTGGTISGLIASVGGIAVYDISGLALSAGTFRAWAAAGDNAAAKAGIFSGADLLTGSAFDDRLLAYGGHDTMAGGAGADILDGGAGDDDVFGGTGNDTLADPGGANFLRGEEGDDFLTGGSEFDDIHGNMGADTAAGGAGDDWVVGGKDNDLLFGNSGGDIVYGNLGDDFCDGGDGADLIRGGQANDSLAGAAGDDYLSGDRGEDTISGGGGADTFHSWNEAGLDRVLDFSVAQGDRVLLDAGTTYTLAQVGADTVLTMSAGQVVLVGVSMSSLLAGSIVVG